MDGELRGRREINVGLKWGRMRGSSLEKLRYDVR